MTDINTLAKSDKPFPIARAATLVNFARNQGMTDHQIQAIAEQELSINSSPSFTSFKARLVGLVGMIWLPIMGGAAAYKASQSISMTQVAILAGISLVFFAMFLSGHRMRRSAAFAAAVLRARASGMTPDEISLLKDRPELRRCTDTHRLLTAIQEQKRPSGTSATSLGA